MKSRAANEIRYEYLSVPDVAERIERLARLLESFDATSASVECVVLSDELGESMSPKTNTDTYHFDT